MIRLITGVPVMLKMMKNDGVIVAGRGSGFACGCDVHIADPGYMMNGAASRAGDIRAGSVIRAASRARAMKPVARSFY